MIFECPHCAEHITVPADMVGGQMYCSACGHLMSIPADARSRPPGTPLQGVTYAGFWIRLVAALVDTIVIAIPSSIAIAIMPFLGGFPGLIIWIAYKSLCLANWDGQTVGKKVCGIRVVGDDLRPITQGQAFGRTCAEILGTLVLYVGYVMAGFTQRKQALHDKVAGTVHIYS